MKLRILSLSMLAALAACNNSADSPVSESTFASEAVPVTNVDSLPIAVALGTSATTITSQAEDEFADRPLVDDTVYGTDLDDSVALEAVTEKSSVMHHEIELNGVKVKFTARAGHLIAYAHNRVHGVVTKDPRAAIYYTSYTRDDLPKHNRPVTFFWNGGPGSSSQYLHMGSWAPKRLVTNVPVIPAEYQNSAQPIMPVINDAETLLDQTDLVFVDPVGTGYSTAIAPNANEDFWGMEIDTKILRDFITRYINTYNRQSSPKYLYGESYGGIRTPIVARLLLEDGTSNFIADSGGRPPVILSGVVLQSPVMDYNSSCQDGPQSTGAASCQESLPTYAAVADFYGKAKIRGDLTFKDFMTKARNFADTEYAKVYTGVLQPTLRGDNSSIKTPFDRSLKDDSLKLDAFIGMPYRDYNKRKLAAIVALNEQRLLTVNAFAEAEGDAVAAIPLLNVVEACAPAYTTPNFYKDVLGKPIPITNRLSRGVNIRAKSTPQSYVALTPQIQAQLPAQINRESVAALVSKLSAETVKAGALNTYAYMQQIVNIDTQWIKGQPSNIYNDICNSQWANFAFAPEGQKYFESLNDLTGVGYPDGFTGEKFRSLWMRYPNMPDPIFLGNLKPGYNINGYDGRIATANKSYDPGDFDKPATNAAMADLIPNYTGYRGKTPYTGVNENIIHLWDWSVDPSVKFSAERVRTSLPDIIQALTLQPDLKVLVIHGYTDLRTPFHQSELDLKNAGLEERVPVHTFEGGHMTYHNEASRAPMKAVLNEFYTGQIGGPTSGPVSVPQASMSTAASTALSSASAPSQLGIVN